MVVVSWTILEFVRSYTRLHVVQTHSDIMNNWLSYTFQHFIRPHILVSTWFLEISHRTTRRVRLRLRIQKMSSSFLCLFDFLFIDNDNDTGWIVLVLVFRTTVPGHPFRFIYYSKQIYLLLSGQSLLNVFIVYLGMSLSEKNKSVRVYTSYTINTSYNRPRSIELRTLGEQTT